MTDELRRRRLSRAELDALKFAGRRQLARWSNKPRLSPNQQAQRHALKQAVRVLLPSRRRLYRRMRTACPR
ncbi:MAG: hypothetical protein ACR2H2_07825 [Solirubrobacteraceae bacterium]